MKTAVDIYKLLPKTNCGACATPTCFGFAARVAARMASVTACPKLSDNARKELQAGEEAPKDSPGTVYEQALESLKPRVRALDFQKIAALFKADYISPDRMEIVFLNEKYRVTKEKILDASGKEPRPWISILIYNHLLMPDPPPPSGEWVSFGSIPASHAKDKAWAAHVEEVIAGHFSGNVEGLKAACEQLGGRKTVMNNSHDAAYEFRFFPVYPVMLLFYDAVPEENFPAECKMLLDKNAPHYLDIESIVVLGEEFAGRMTG